MAKKKTNPEKPIDSIRHKDKRKNIPTEELRGFMEKEKAEPYKVLYPRDPSLDPQLVWKGKDAQDAQDLAVPTVPIYIQEKIHPHAIIENLRAEAKKEAPGQAELFSDFNGLPFEELVDFYQHESNWTNRMILGDSLLVMNSLAEKEGLRGKVQCIYMDPPYGIKFGFNWQVSTKKRDVKNTKAEDITREPEQIKAFRDTWELGIHSYLAYLRDRFVVARDLLTETGSIFVQIGDNNVHLVRCILDEVFGSDNFVSLIAFTKTPGGLESTERIPARLDYLIWYAKHFDMLKYRPIYDVRPDDISAGFSYLELPDGTMRPLTHEEKTRSVDIPEGARLFRPISLTKPGPGSKYEIVVDGKVYTSGNRWWGSPKESILKLIKIGRIRPFGNTLRYIQYLDEFPLKPLSNLWSGLVGAKNPIYVVQTNDIIVQRCLLMTTDPGDLVLDPTCGSGTTAYVCEQWGRRWITIETSRVALALARTRLMAARYPYYILADSSEGVEKEAEITGQVPPEYKTNNDIRKGFVYKRARHVTLSSIANDPDIKEGMTREEIEKAIARHAEQVILYDRPYEDNKRIRVTGPFTVESLSPHRVLSTEVDKTKSMEEAQTEEDAVVFHKLVLDNLLKAGVQNTKKKERLKFDELHPHAGMWIQATGTYTDSKGNTKRVAVSIGPEHGTVGQEHIKEAAKEAVQGIGHELLIVCGYAFDPHVPEEVKRYGELTILPTRMNADLSMGDELLKKTGAGNLFMVFGEPDIAIDTTKDGKITVEILGVDIYDPTTGEIRSSSPDEIACWFIDTSYNEESFFVRHAYFCGDDDPYEKLRKTLRAEVDEQAWQSLYSTKSRPFDKPSTGKIAVKVINHYGDEVLKVYTL